MASAEALIRQLAGALKATNQQVVILQQAVAAMASRPRSVQEEIDAIEGRRIESTLEGEITFTSANVGSRLTPINLPVSQDGPFVQTHYPMALWRPSQPNNATNLGHWSPVSSFPLPTQQNVPDIIDILYEMEDGGNQRQFQNAPRGPLLSRPDNVVPCPIPTLWSPNTNIRFIATLLSVTWGNAAVHPTEGTLHVTIPGYRIVNL